MKNLLKYFQDNEINVWEEDGKIKFSGSKDKVSDEIIARLKDNKEELIHYFKSLKENVTPIKASSNQLALWIERKMGNTSGIIHNGMLKKMSGTVDVDQVKDAFHQVVQRHEALRMTFYEEEYELYLQASLNDDRFFTYEELEIDIESDAKTYVKNEMNKTLNLKDGPLFRVGVYKYGTDNYLLGIWAHHIITDAYSLFLIEEEFYKFYDAIKNKGQHQFSDISSYFDTVSGERTYLESNRYQLDMAYYKDNLDLSLVGSSLPKFKMVKDNEEKYKISTYIHTYSDQLTNKIKDYAFNNNITVFSLALSIFNLTLHYFNDNHKTSLGFFGSNRMTDQQLNQVGYFSNALVFQKEIIDDTTLQQYINDVKTQVMQLLGHQHMPFTSLVGELNPYREGGKPFFDVAFDSLLFPKNNEVKALQSKLQIIDCELVKGSTDYDLIVWISEEEGSFRFEYRYNNQLFDEYQIEIFAETMEGILKEIHENQSISLNQIALDYKKSKAIFNAVNDTDRNYTYNHILDIIKEQYTDQENRMAIYTNNKELSYQEMRNFSEWVGWNLREKGVKKGDYVGVLLEKSCYLIPSIIGIWVIGGVYVPIDPEFPANRKEYIVNNTNLKAIIKGSKETLEVQNVSIIEAEPLINDWENNDRYMEINTKEIHEIAEPDAPAYVMYTSGSTGNPKGVIISHSSFVNLLYDMADAVSLSKEDKVLAITSICFDISMLEMFMSFIAGASIIMLSYEDSKSGRRILESIIDKDITVMQATPSSYEMLYDYYTAENIQVPIIKTCLCGGESYELDLVDKIQKMAEHVYNVYGPTETTIWSTYYEIPKPCDALMIGKPAANTIIKIADKHGRTLPIGVPGELLIGGAGVFQGYFNNEALTTQALVKLDDEVLYYKTGDWAYMDPKGNLKFLGRRDSQVKIRGFRVEISEIENVFRKYEEVSNTSVITIEENGNSILVAAVTMKPDADLKVEHLKAFVSEYLPGYMMPSHIITMDKLPMTNNNKIDKKMIKEIVTVKLKNNLIINEVEDNELEKQLRIIWESLLDNKIGSTQIGFFEAGGNSLLLNKLVLELEKQFEKRVDIIDLLKFNTIHKMAIYIGGNGMNAPSPEQFQKTAQRRRQYLGRRRE